MPKWVEDKSDRYVFATTVQDFRDATVAEIAPKAIIISHSNSGGLYATLRNVSDEANWSDIMTDVAKANDIVISNPKPFVTFENFGDNALLLRLLCFIDDIEARINTRSDLHKVISDRLQEEGIEIAFPQMDLHFDPERALKIKLEPDR